MITIKHRHGLQTTVALRTSQSHMYSKKIRYYNQTHSLRNLKNVKSWIIISSISKHITLCMKKKIELKFARPN